MNGFEEMASQYEKEKLKEFVAELDDEYGDVSVDLGIEVANMLIPAIEALEQRAEHPLEEGIRELLLVASSALMIGAISSPTAVGMLLQPVIVPCFDLRLKLEAVLRAQLDHYRGEKGE